MQTEEWITTDFSSETMQESNIYGIFNVRKTLWTKNSIPAKYFAKQKTKKQEYIIANPRDVTSRPELQKEYKTDIWFYKEMWNFKLSSL